MLKATTRVYNHTSCFIIKQIQLVMFVGLISFNLQAHDYSATATYLGNEAVMIENGSNKIVFDPFFHNDYGTYQKVPDEIRKAMFLGVKPYDNIDVVFISHAHGDHFAAHDMVIYLQKHPDSRLVAPSQAIDKIKRVDDYQSIMKQVVSLDLKLGDEVKTINSGDLLIEVVRIPHAGWPGRADISNLVYRVTLAGNVTIMHMGDADPNDLHFKPYKDHWQKTKTNAAFVPYWFFISESGPIILDERINTESSIGIHVPTKVPESLKISGEDYFSKPGEHKSVNHKH